MMREVTHRTRVKICGITRAADLQAAVAAGADAIGLVFHATSPRHVTVEQARELCALLQPFVTAVGLFVDLPAPEVHKILQQVPLDLLQFHGHETPEFCAQFNRRWIKAIRMQPEIDLGAEHARFSAATGLLLDAWHPQLMGGTGEQFSWSRIPASLASQIILAGGLNPDNVAQAVSQVRPWAVDVSSGVEVTPGIKDTDKIFAFIKEVRHGEHDNQSADAAN